MTAGIGSDPIRSTPSRKRIFGAVEIGVPIYRAGFQDRDALLHLERAFPRRPEGRKKINRKNPFPADGTLRLGLIPSQTRIRKSALFLQINHNKQYKKINGFSCRRERKNGGDREEEIKDR